MLQDVLSPSSRSFPVVLCSVNAFSKQSIEGELDNRLSKFLTSQIS
jgi:hypothetical protein